MQNNGRSAGHSANFCEICSHPSKENVAGRCKPSFKSTKLKISETFSVVLGMMNGQQEAFKGQPLSIMFTTPASINHLTIGNTMSSRVAEYRSRGKESSARGSWQVLALSDHGPRPLRRQFVAFLSMFFAFLPWLHRALSCGVLLLMRRLHMFVLRLFVTYEDFRLRTAPNVIFDVLKDFTADTVAPVHLTCAFVGQGGS